MDEIQFIAAHPDCGILSDIENVSYRVLRDYLIFLRRTKMKFSFSLFGTEDKIPKN